MCGIIEGANWIWLESEISPSARSNRKKTYPMKIFRKLAIGWMVNFGFDWKWCVLNGAQFHLLWWYSAKLQTKLNTWIYRLNDFSCQTTQKRMLADQKWENEHWARASYWPFFRKKKKWIPWNLCKWKPKYIHKKQKERIHSHIHV